MFYNEEGQESTAQQKQRARETLTALGLGDRLHHLPNQLSGGQQQRVAIARALVNQPSIILADEPTGNLDSHSSMDILELIENLNQQGVTIVMVTHAPDVAEHADRVICMLDGKILSDGDANDNHCMEAKSGLGVA